MTAELVVSEIFQSIQGEGPSQGAPCTFLRLAGCNLSCSWCDTEYSWNWSRFDKRTQTTRLSVEDVCEKLAGARRLVITGGEPLLQQRALPALLAALPADLTIEIETNGTLVPLPELCARVDQWNVSPKLAHAGDSAARRINLIALEAFRETGCAWLKFVVDSVQDMAEIQAITAGRWSDSRIILMPQCRDTSELVNKSPQVVNLSLSSGYMFTNRLHLQLWGGERGR